MRKQILILLILIIIFLIGCKKSDNISGAFHNIFPDFSGIFSSLPSSSSSSVKIVTYSDGTCKEYYDWGDNKNAGGYFISTKSGQSLELTDTCIGNQLTEYYCDASSNNGWGYKTKNYNCGQNKCKTQTESGTSRVMGYCIN